MKFIFTRHAQSNGNANGNYEDAQSGNLSELGEKQAVNLAENLSDYKFTKIYVSPEKRAMQTALPYLEKSGLKATICPDAIEACWKHNNGETAPKDRRAGRDVRIDPSHAEPFSYG